MAQSQPDPKTDMQAAGSHNKAGAANRELIALLLASIACVGVLTIMLANAASGPIHGVDAKLVLLCILLVVAATIAFGFAWITTRRAYRGLRQARQEIDELRRNLLTAEAIVRAEPQVVVFWDPGRDLKVVTHTLTAIPGLPDDQKTLLRFGAWLDPASAAGLKAALDGLFQAGRPFNLMLRTTEGGHLEADGRAAGSRAVLRLRGISSYKQDLVRLLEQHEHQTRELDSVKALLDALPMPAWLKSRDGRITWANQAYVSAVEAKDVGEVADRQLELLDQRQRKMLDSALSRGSRYSRRMPLVVNGERKAHDVVVVGLEHAVIAAAIDVSELERAQGELNRQMTTHDRTLDRVRTAAAVFDRSQQLTFYNEAFAKTWKLDPAWLDEKPTSSEILDRLQELSRLPSMVDYRQWKTSVLDCHTSGTIYDDWWPLPDGRLLHVVGEQRHDGGVTFLYDDATERLALESRYNELIDVQRETLDSLKEGVAVFDTDGRLKLYNSSFLSIWKLSRDFVEQQPHIDEIIKHAQSLYDDDAAWTRLSRAATAVSDEREQLEGQMLRPDMTVIDYAAAPLPDGAMLITFADVTASKRYERALEERNEALVASDRLKNQFISHVSYELRTPLTNIIGFGELLSSPRTGPLTKKQREYLADIQASSTTLLSIIDDILDLATIDAGTLELKLAPVSVHDIIDAAILGVRERAMRARLTIDIATTDDDIEFIADEARVRQVLYNLLSNAVGFSKPGGLIRLAVWREDGRVAFAVEDEGVGIPKEQQARVMERFESRTRGSRHRGAGLGLSIVKSLVELHHGDMQLESEPSRGTRVTVRFPEDPTNLPQSSPAQQIA
ncbi:MAG: ATP-binding protein [Hyphomicrobiaceae bacterium]